MKALDVIKKHNTRNPYTIARLENIEVIDEPLGEVNGYYQNLNGLKFIHLNIDVPEYFHRYILAHLLYPALMDTNDMQFIKRKASYTYSSTEIPANKFAIELLLDDSELQTTGSFEKLMQKYKMSEDDINDLKDRLSSLLPAYDFETQVNNVINKFRKD